MKASAAVSQQIEVGERVETSARRGFAAVQTMIGAPADSVASLASKFQAVLTAQLAAGRAVPLPVLTSVLTTALASRAPHSVKVAVWKAMLAQVCVFVWSLCPSCPLSCIADVFPGICRARVVHGRHHCCGRWQLAGAVVLRRCPALLSCTLPTPDPSAQCMHVMLPVCACAAGGFHRNMARVVCSGSKARLRPVSPCTAPDCRVRLLRTWPT